MASSSPIISLIFFTLSGRVAGAKRVLAPIASASKIATVPPDLFSKFQISFYEDPIDAVYKSMADLTTLLRM